MLGGNERARVKERERENEKANIDNVLRLQRCSVLNRLRFAVLEVYAHKGYHSSFLPFVPFFFEVL